MENFHETKEEHVDVKYQNSSQQLGSNGSNSFCMNNRGTDGGPISPVSLRPLGLVQSTAQSKVNSASKEVDFSGSRKENIDVVFKNIKKEPFCMMHTVQQSVIFQELDFSYITSRIGVMSYPAEGLESACRNHVEGVREFLDLRHPGHYAVYNVSGHAYSSIRFKAKVHEAGWPIKKAPPFETLVSLCYSMYLYLKEDLKNVCIVHCLDGKSSSAVLVCAFIIFCKLFKQPEDAVELFCAHRCPVYMTPSQLRYIHYVSDVINNPSVLPHNDPIVLHSICMRPIPLFDELESGCRPFAEVYVGEECVVTSSEDYKNIRHYSIAEKHIVIPLSAVVTGDVTIIVYHADSKFSRNTIGSAATLKIFQLQFYSGFISPGTQSISFSRNELDGVEEPDRYSDDFIVSILLKSSDFKRVYDSSPLMQKVSELKSSPKLLFNADEDLETLTSHSVDKENISGESPMGRNSNVVHSLSCNECGKMFSESDNSVIPGTVLSSNEDFKSVPFSPEVDLLHLRFLTASPKVDFLEDDSPLVDLLDSDGNSLLPSSDFDFLMSTDGKVSSHSINFDPLSRKTLSAVAPEKCHQTSDPFFLRQDNKTYNIKTSEDDPFDFFTSGTTNMIHNNKKNSSRQNVSLPISCLSSSTSAFNVSSDVNEDTLHSCYDSLSPFSSTVDATIAIRDNVAVKKQSLQRHLATGSVSHHASTPNLNEMVNSQSDPFADLGNINSSYVLPNKDQDKNQKTFQTSSTQSEGTSQKLSYKRSHISNIFNDNCNRGMKKYSSVRPKFDGDEFEDLVGSQGFGRILRKVDEPKTIAKLRHEELVKEMDPEHLKIMDWVDHKEHNIRALLCSMHTILWEGARWQEVAMHQLIRAADVKKYYRKACLAIHPDKQIGTEHESLAQLIFMQLKDAWSKFEKQPDLT